MSVGAFTRLGLAIESQITSATWPSSNAATISALVPIDALETEVGAELQATAGTHGYGVMTDLDRQTLPANLTLPLPVTYEGLEPLWCCALGYQPKRHGSTVFPEEVVPGAYRHRYEIDNVLQADYWTSADGWDSGDGLASSEQQKTRRLTVAATTGNVAAWEWLSAMVEQLTLHGRVNRPLTASVQFLAGTLDTTPTTNTLAALQALGTPTAPRVLWHHSVFRLGAYSASTPLDSSHNIRVSAFTLRLENRLVVTYSPRVTLTPEEHVRGDAPRITGQLTVPRYVADTLINGQRAGTTYMADLICTGEPIGVTGENYTLELYWPTIRLSAATQPVWNSAGQLSQTLGFEAYAPTTAAAGMPATIHPTPFIVQIHSSVSTHFLE